MYKWTTHPDPDVEVVVEEVVRPECQDFLDVGRVSPVHVSVSVKTGVGESVHDILPMEQPVEEQLDVHDYGLSFLSR